MEYEEDPFWESTHSEPNKQQQGKSSNTALAGVVFGILAAMFGLRLMFPDSNAGSGPSPLASAAPTTLPSGGDDRHLVRRSSVTNNWVSWLQSHLPGEQPLQMRSDFKGRVSEWTGTASGWSWNGGVVTPGKLRLWRPTLNSKDYELQFRASIERKGMGWAFRARDTDNYYATKILISGTGLSSSASILRYGVMNSWTFDRAELPLPMTLQRDRRYNITAMVRGSRFTTLIDGHVVDEWSDSKLKSGGVGFFADQGDASAIEWADFREQKGWLSRWLSASLFIPPNLMVP
ncbi:hypothetical protein [uncultured Paludibaculum sp.]|uniref:hypothetical protein n=1 Tax=uncultured Paludibaculum sp. TaxID=1765020 RepID=UPI002AAB5D51|nr:hypothetical protein [uncultured Paludibaculum sp.]